MPSALFRWEVDGKNQRAERFGWTAALERSVTEISSNFFMCSVNRSAGLRPGAWRKATDFAPDRRWALQARYAIHGGCAIIQIALSRCLWVGARLTFQGWGGEDPVFSSVVGGAKWLNRLMERR